VATIARDTGHRIAGMLLHHFACNSGHEPRKDPDTRSGSTSTPKPAASPTAAVNQTTTGTITGDEIWRGELLITGDVVVGSRSTLTIEPGTTCAFYRATG